MEQVTGMAWITGHVDDQPRIQQGPSDPNAGMHAAFALIVGLAERDATGRGSLLEVTMVEGALNAAAELVLEATAYGNLLERDGNRSPHVAPQGLYRARDDETWLAVSVATVEQWAGLVDALGAPEWATDPELAAAWDDRMEALLRVCRLVVDRCASEGQLRAELEPSVAAEVLWGILSIPLWDQLIVDRGWSPAEYRERVGAIAEAALLVAAGPAADRR
jgi:crotonobetainyl-CoA:carnitine CoA-transferase CaiB-like acyl-CoA transferase